MKAPIFSVFADEIPKIDRSTTALIQSHLYLCAFHIEYKQPLWVAYRVCRSDFETDNVLSRNFTIPKQGKGHVIPEKLYGHNDYDVGHLVALATVKASKYAHECNWMFCVAIQHKDLNRGVFLKCEDFIRELAEEGSELDVMVSCLFLDDMEPMEMAVSAGMHHVVPSHFVVMVKDVTSGESYAWRMPQTAQRNDEFQAYEIPYHRAKKLVSDQWWESA